MAAKAFQLRRCEYEALPADGDVSVGDIFAEIQTRELTGVKWLGWRAEPLFFGLEKLIASCTIDEAASGLGEALSDSILETIAGLETVQSARLLSAERYAGDPFDVCSRLFTVDASGLGSLQLDCIQPAQALQLLQRGAVVIDDFMPVSVAAAVSELVETSLAKYPDFQEDGIQWRQPAPRNARSDVATWLAAGERPATDDVFATCVVPAFNAVLQDLRSLMSLQGESEQQLAWYPGDGARYAPHTDAQADAETESDHRKVTGIFYCNTNWQPEHGGALRLWLPDSHGGETVDVEPVAGKLLLFLSGCIRHEVRSCYRSRCAVTYWFR